MPNDEMLFDPNIYLPDDLGGASYVDTERIVLDRNVSDEDDLGVEEFNDFEESDVTEYLDDGDDEEGIDILEIPAGYSIVEEIPRTALDGTQMVDLVLEIAEVPRATTYEVRLA